MLFRIWRHSTFTCLSLFSFLCICVRSATSDENFSVRCFSFHGLHAIMIKNPKSPSDERNPAMKITVLDKCTVTTGDVSLSSLEAFGEVRFFDTLPREKLAAAIGDSEIVVCNKANITAALMDACPALRYIGVFATGFNNIDIEAANARWNRCLQRARLFHKLGRTACVCADSAFRLRADDYAASVAVATGYAPRRSPISPIRPMSLPAKRLGSSASAP